MLPLVALFAILIRFKVDALGVIEVEDEPDVDVDWVEVISLDSMLADVIIDWKLIDGLFIFNEKIKNRKESF